VDVGCTFGIAMIESLGMKSDGTASIRLFPACTEPLPAAGLSDAFFACIKLKLGTAGAFRFSGARVAAIPFDVNGFFVANGAREPGSRVRCFAWFL
jgi:hypothetical protein